MSNKEGAKIPKKTYNIRDSPVVTHPSTSLTITSLSMGERTGSRVFWYLWSYVGDCSGALESPVPGPRKPWDDDVWVHPRRPRVTTTVGELHVLHESAAPLSPSLPPEAGRVFRPLGPRAPFLLLRTAPQTFSRYSSDFALGGSLSHHRMRL
ncbi:hypothetical protein NKR19_g8960 [Coniochaeta hoffmannii]|uniref:Uncharacterized protein n=1 Tax=Coniochaeta hoffmannii TaxID=91930 RepID=A0AA38R460_9PEZI|nr:hypothetical protein NKR19_g8960 [Coniochaeta hoffmannii]